LDNFKLKNAILDIRILFLNTGVSRMKKLHHGFTLIELLIVIAILGVLATVVIVAVNPLEQLARTRDAGRISAVTQIGHNLQAYATGHDGTLPDESATWLTDIQTAGVISSLPPVIAYGDTTITQCTTNAENQYCYSSDGDSPPVAVIVYTRLESTSNNSLCATPGDFAWEVFDTVNGRGGLVCSATEPTFDAAGQTFAN
jgi:prepilin-type N-terminal cleavage/methylation domain-containing protein